MSRVRDEVIRLFDALPGDKAVRIYAPASERGSELVIKSNVNKQLFVASAIKGFVLCEALRQVDSAEVVEKIESRSWRSTIRCGRSAAQRLTRPI